MKNKIDTKSKYILRYYLPVKPYFDESFTEVRFAQLLKFCKETKTDAVMFYVALNPDFYYMPDTVDYARKSRDRMLPYISRLRAEGIGYQINFQNLLGSTTGGVDFRKLYGWECLVDQLGRESTGCACPIGKRFRETSQQRLKIWAETKPDIFWLDDDLRMHNHGTPDIPNVKDGYRFDYYCFCNDHIKGFNERFGTSFTREKLVKEMLKPGKPSEIRKMYLDYVNDTATDMAAWIEKTVHSVDPDIRLALMTSIPDSHSAEGRKWKEYLSSLSGSYEPIVRPHFGPYRESNPREFVTSYRFLAQTIKTVKDACGNEATFAPEIENTRFTVYSKSSAATAMQLALSGFAGCNNVTLSLFDLDGGALSDEPEYRSLLKKQKPFSDRLCALDLGKASDVGVTFPIAENSASRLMLSEGENYEHLCGDNRQLENYFLKIGIPCKYEKSSDVKADEFVALDSYGAKFLSDEELKNILKCSVFLDGQAADVLCRRGYSELIGIKSLNRRFDCVNAEFIKCFKRSDGTDIRIPSRVPKGFWYAAETSPDTESLSEFLTPAGEKYTALALYKNTVGGKIYTYTAFENFGDGFFNHYRIKLFKDIISSSAPQIDRLDCAAYALFAVKRDDKGKKYYLLSNLSADALEKASINGKKIKPKLQIYQTAVYKRYGDRITLVGKT